MKKIFFLLLLLCMNFAAARNFSGTATIKIINPTDTVLAVCTNNNKYLMEPGNTYDVQFCVRNHEKEKIVKRVYMKAMPKTDAKIDIGVHFEPMYLENIPPGEDDCFMMHFSIPEDTPLGDYEVDLLVGTDEHPMGAYRDIMLIKVRTYGDELYLLYGFIVIIILIILITRFLWIRKVNKKNMLSKPKNKPRKMIHKKTTQKTKRTPKHSKIKGSQKKKHRKKHQ